MERFESDSLIECDITTLEIQQVRNRANLDRFWRNQYHHIVKRVRRLCGGRQDKAEDLVSQATLRLLNFIETSESQPIEIGALFWRILHNLVIDQHRTTRRAAAILDHSVALDQEADLWRLPPASCDTHAQLAASQELAAVQRIVAELPDEARSLFAERFIEEHSYREIAIRLCITEALARKRVQKLRALIAAPARDAQEDDRAPSQKCPPHVYHHEAA